MTPVSVEAKLAAHNERLDNVEDSLVRFEKKLDTLLFGTLGTLVTALGGAALLIFKHA